MKGKTIVTCVLAVLVAQTAAAGDGAALRRFGMFVGSNDGGRERVTLAYAATDAMTVKSVMEEVGGVDPEDAILLRDPDARELAAGFAGMRESIARAKATNRRVEFVLYYSGHSDEFGILLGGERFSYLDLRNSIQSIGADVNIAILDSCSSGAFTRLKGGSRQPPFLLDESVTTKGHAFITSSSASEAAQESDSIGASFFTHFLVSGLRGAADATKDGKVTLNEAYSYAFDETLTRTSTTLAGPQHAGQELRLAGAGNLVLTDLRIATAGLVLSSDLAGRVFVNGRDGRLVAEIRKEAGAELTLALPPGSYRLTVDGDDGLKEGAVTVGSRGKVAVTQSLFRSRSPEIARERGDGGFDDDAGKSSDDAEEGLWIFGERIDPEVAARVGESLVHLKYLFSFLPIFAKPSEERRVVHELSLKIIGGSYRVEGFDIGLVSFVDEDVKGAQVAGVAGFIGDDLYGAQASGVFNIAGGRIFGAQAAGVFNIASGRVYGGQGAGVFNIAGGRIHGAQGSGVFNIAEGDVHGAQAAGVFNIAEGDLHGFQGSGLFSISERNLHGVQASGLFNIAEDVRGAQVSLVNVGGEVRGTQIGLINISERMYGLPLGLINISGNGLFNPSVWSDDTGFTFAGLQFGAGALYTLMYAGTPAAGPWNAVGLGAGLGLHLTLGALHLDVDVSAKSYAMGPTAEEAFRSSAMMFVDASRTVYRTGDLSGLADIPVYPSGRVHLGFTVFRSVALLAGVSLESLAVPGQERNRYFHSGSPWIVPVNGVDSLWLYPRWFFGIRI